jgi:hypothetical protein
LRRFAKKKKKVVSKKKDLNRPKTIRTLRSQFARGKKVAKHGNRGAMDISGRVGMMMMMMIVSDIDSLCLHHLCRQNERRPRPKEDKNREDLQLRPQDAAENQVDDGHRAQGLVASLRPTAILRDIINTPLEDHVNLYYEGVEFICHYVASEAYSQIIRAHRIAVSKIIKLA